MAWHEIWRGNAGDGREVVAKRNSDGDIRITTTTAEDAEGLEQFEENSTLIMPPVPAGSEINIDPDLDQSLEDALIKDGDFSESDARDIAERVRRAAAT